MFAGQGQLWNYGNITSYSPSTIGVFTNNIGSTLVAGGALVFSAGGNSTGSFVVCFIYKYLYIYISFSNFLKIDRVWGKRRVFCRILLLCSKFNFVGQVQFNNYVLWRSSTSCGLAELGEYTRYRKCDCNFQWVSSADPYHVYLRRQFCSLIFEN